MLRVEEYKTSLYKVIQHHVLKICESFPGDTVLMDELTLYNEIQEALDPTFQEWGVKLLEINLKEDG